jgi:predicted nucleotidyltransferase
MGLSEEDREKIVDWAKRHPEIQKVYLYGSRARGDHRPDSDIDLGIEMVAPNGDAAYRAWSAFHSDFEESPDLNLTVEAHLEWYEPNAGLDRVGKCGVERDGVLLYPVGV